MKIRDAFITLRKVGSGVEDRMLARIDLKIVNDTSDFIKALTLENLGIA